jgi:hypothetical protein
VQGDVARSAFRYAVTGALVHLSDEYPPPAEISLSAQARPAGLEVALSLRQTAGEPGFSTAPPYRPIKAADLEALARADGVQVEREGTTIRLTLPWVSPA